MPAYVVGEKIRDAAELEQYKQLAPPSFKEHPAILRAIHCRVVKVRGGGADGHRQGRSGA